MSLPALPTTTDATRPPLRGPARDGMVRGQAPVRRGCDARGDVRGLAASRD